MIPFFQDNLVKLYQGDARNMLDIKDRSVQCIVTSPPYWGLRKCKGNKVPAIVLDPFAGTGTTLWVAKKLGRRAVGYELSEEYCQLALERIRQAALV